MARPGVTYTEIASAAQQIAASGRFPTVEGVRLILGTGSNSTVGQHLRTWKMKQDSTQQIATKENIPETLIAAIKGVWELVMTQSETTIQIIQEETQQTLSSTKQELQQLQQSNNEWQQRYHQIKQERDGFASEKSTLHHLLTDAKVDHAAVLEKLLSVEQQNKEKQLRIDELQRQNHQNQANLEHYREASLGQRLEAQQRYEQQNNQLERTIQQLTFELSEKNKSHVILQKNNQQFYVENDHLKIQLSKLEVQQQSQTEKITQALNESTQKMHEAKNWQEKYEGLQLKYDNQNKEHIELKTQYTVASQISIDLKSALKQQQDQNQTLANEKWMIGQEKAQLEGQLKLFSLKRA
jgi:hypothetical protein